MLQQVRRGGFAEIVRRMIEFVTQILEFVTHIIRVRDTHVTTGEA